MRFYCLIIVLIIHSHLFSQDSLPQKITRGKPAQYFRLVYENDVFTGIDRYYTQGIRFEYTADFLRYSPFSKLLLVPKNFQRYYSLSLHQDCFTPKSILSDSILYNDRPFAGTFILRHQVIAMSEGAKLRMSSRLDLGVIGPAAKGEETQKLIHRLTNNDEPHGWNFQMKNALVINYSIKCEKGIVNKNAFSLIVFGDGRAGTLYDDVAGGVMIRAGLVNSYFSNLGISDKVSGKRFQIYITAKGRAKWVAYNGTLQGGAFTTNVYSIPANEIERMVYSASASLVLATRRICLEYSDTYLTREFKWGVDHGWGSCNVLFRF